MIPETTPSEADKPLGFNAEELGYSVEVCMIGAKSRARERGGRRLRNL